MPAAGARKVPWCDIIGAMSEDTPQNPVVAFLEQLRSSHLLMLLTGLFVLDLFIPDPIPLIDEIVLGLLTLLVARWKTRPAAAPPSSKPPPKNVTPASD